MLNEKSLTELRTIAHGLGVEDIFSKSVASLIQEIEKAHKELIPTPKVSVPIEYKTISTAPECDKDELMELLQPYIQRGLKVAIADETWRFSYGKRQDTGTLRMPIRTALRKAQEVLG